MQPNVQLLGRRKSPDQKHFQLYRARPAVLPAKPTYIVLGIDWFEAWFEPEMIDGKPWVGVGSEKDWGDVAGGHAIRVKPPSIEEPKALCKKFDQLETPRCVGFSIAAAISNLRGITADPGAVYDEAQQLDSFPGPPPDYEGTEVRSGFDALRKFGPSEREHRKLVAHPELGITANYWTRTAAGVRTITGTPAGVPIGLANTWHSSGFPDLVFMPDATLDDLLQKRGGDAGYMQLR